jgi:hypothetical protein
MDQLLPLTGGADPSHAHPVRTSRRSQRAEAWIAALVGVAGCDALGPAKKPSQAIVFAAESDPGVPLAGVQVLHRGKVAATTQADGSAPLQITGQEGETFDFDVKCPAGYRAPEAPIAVVLRRTAGAGVAARFPVRCVPRERTLVVAVRADGAPNVPVLYLGREVARTDGSGAAHVAFRLAATESVALTLDTTEQSKLRPQSPTMTFHGAERDQIVSFAQKFEAEVPKPKPAVVRAAPAPEPIGPVRLNRHLR